MFCRVLVTYSHLQQSFTIADCYLQIYTSLNGMLTWKWEDGSDGKASCIGECHTKHSRYNETLGLHLVVCSAFIHIDDLPMICRTHNFYS